MRTTFGICALLASLGGVSLYAADASTTWNPKAAGGYLDERQSWWQTWPSAARDHETFCVSCHTAAPYALSRQTLRSALKESGPSVPERKLAENVTKRVRIWNEAEPFYSDEKQGAPKTAEARGTESVLNALILVSYNPRNSALSADARTALDNMWALQLKTGDSKGAFTWLNFHNEPWEAEDSQYYGATLAAITVGLTPKDYQATPEVQANVKLLREYLQRGYDAQSPILHAMVLWASAKLPNLLTKEQQRSAIDAAFTRQKEDGGWSMTDVVGTWKRRDGTPLETRSDAYATGVITYALQQAGVKPDQAGLKRGLAWLVSNQDPSAGSFPAYSMNKQRDLKSDVGRFMADAATAYAVLALTIQ
jgi:squalene-hopene/tetraprenyl-beta-curcumene cyclase